MTEITVGRPDIVVTHPFRVTSGDYFYVLLTEWLPRYGWTLFVPVVLTVILGVALHDVRWLLVALMMVFIMAPIAMSFIFTYYMLTPEARRNILDKRVEICHGQYIKLIYESKPEESIAWRDIINVRTTSRFTVYRVRGEHMQFLLIPREAFCN